MGQYRNKRTGEIITVPDGPRAVPIGPQSPDAPYKGPKAAADVEKTQTDTRKTVQDLRQNPISKEDTDFINAMRDQIGDMDSTLQYARDAAKVVDRFKTGPTRAQRVRDSMTGPDDGFFGSIAANLQGRLYGVDGEDIADYQALERYKNLDVLKKQTEQKGPQTESDAMRYALAGISPDKLPTVNAKIIADQVFRGNIVKQKPDFFLKWANRNGSLGALENGKSVDKAWNEYVESKTKAYESKPAIMRLNPNGLRPKKKGDGWKIERLDD